MDIPNYYAIIPAEVRYCPDLSPNQKLLYGEITALANKTGACFAGNEYFANLYGVSKRSISMWVSALRKHGFIKLEMKYKKGTAEIESRHLTLCTYFPHPPRRNIPYPHEEMCVDNTTSNNKDVYIEKLPKELDTPEFQEAWKTFKKHRKEIKKPLTKTATERLLSRCIKEGAGKAAQDLERCYSDGHTWVAPVWDFVEQNKGKKDGRKTKGTRSSDVGNDSKIGRHPDFMAKEL